MKLNDMQIVGRMFRWLAKSIAKGRLRGKYTVLHAAPEPQQEPSSPKSGVRNRLGLPKAVIPSEVQS